MAIANTLPQTFNFDNLPVRTVERDGEIWFVANDVCKALEISNSRDAVNRLDEDERAPVGITDTPSKNQHGESGTQEQTVNIISESGLYSLILTSRKKEAKRFKRWVTHEVLPAIRKTGSYNLAPQIDNSQHVMRAHSLASSAGAAVAKALFAALMADEEQNTHHARFALSLTAGYAGNADNVQLQKIPDGAIVTSIEGLAEQLLEPNGMRPKCKDLVKLVKACIDRLSKML